MIEHLFYRRDARNRLVLMKQPKRLPPARPGQKKVSIVVGQDIRLVIHNEPLTAAGHDRVGIRRRGYQCFLSHTLKRFLIMGLETSKYLHCPEPLSLLKVFPDNRALFSFLKNIAGENFKQEKLGDRIALESATIK